MSPTSEAKASGRNIDKTRRARAHPDRPGADCQAAPASWQPVVDHARCEGKRDCVEVCPFEVFEVRKIDVRDYTALPFLARMKVRAHGQMTAYTPNADACQACGLCAVACPEHAIKLVRS
jgi:NAD-dependent dihydropyrimidine dehydrogenase PreA subunit